MAVAARKIDSVQGRAPANSTTRVYVDSRMYQSSAMPKFEPEEEAFEFEAEAYPFNPAVKTRPAPKAHKKPQAADKPSPVRLFFKKVSVLATVVFIAAALIGVLMRYAEISTEYNKVNTLKSNIAQCEIELTELAVKLNSAVSIDTAREAAQEAGMGYPGADQIVKVDGD